MLPNRFALLALLGLFSLTVHSQEIYENSFGNGLLNVVAKDSSYSLKFGARLQSLYTSDWSIGDDGNSHQGSNFLVRRARLKFGGFAYSPKLRYKIQLGLSNRDISGASSHNSNAPGIILDAVLQWNFYENFVLWAGQAKLPGNRAGLISSSSLQFVDRSLLNGQFNIDRDMGLQLHHSFRLGENFYVLEALALTQGEGRNVTDGNHGGLQYTARVELLPFGKFLDGGNYSGGDLQRHQNPKLALGASYSFNDNAVRSESTVGDYLITDTGLFETDINTFFLDAMFKYRGFSFMGEYAQRTAENPIAVYSDGTPTGGFVPVGDAINLQAGYVFRGNYELAGRFTSLDMDNVLNEDQYTLALSKYFVGHKLKIQTDLSYTTRQRFPDDNLMYRLQFELHF